MLGVQATQQVHTRLHIAAPATAGAAMPWPRAYTCPTDLDVATTSQCRGLSLAPRLDHVQTRSWQVPRSGLAWAAPARADVALPTSRVIQPCANDCAQRRGTKPASSWCNTKPQTLVVKHDRYHVYSASTSAPQRRRGRPRAPQRRRLNVGAAARVRLNVGASTSARPPACASTSAPRHRGGGGEGSCNGCGIT